MVQSAMGTNIVVDPFPLPKFFVDFLQIPEWNTISIKLVQMSSVGSFHFAIELG